MGAYMDIFKCEVCGNVVELLHAEKGELVCCGQPMKLLPVFSEDTGKEKHLPVIENISTGVKVKVGSVEHPMLENHFIEWIEIISADKVIRKKLAPGMTPEAEFCVQGKHVKVRSYCNIHGLWGV